MSDTNSKNQSIQVPPNLLVLVFDGRGGARKSSLEEASEIGHGTNDFGFAWINIRKDESGAEAALANCKLDS